MKLRIPSPVAALVFTFMVVLTSNSSAEAAETRTFTISAVGDIMMGTDYPSDQLRGDEGRELFAHSKAYFEASDIAFGNLEGPLFDGEKGDDAKSEGSNRYLFRTPTSYAKWLRLAGLDVVSLANNHAMDFGNAGLQSTKQVLTKEGLQYSSKNRADTATFDIHGIKIALIALDYYPGARSIVQSKATLEEIRSLRTRFDVVIVSAHSGAEGASAERVESGPESYYGENRGDVIAFSHSAIDAGAGLIIMHGPHVPRAMELYRGHLIAYSLGNFITERGIDIQGRAGLAPLLRAQLDENGRFVVGEITSYKQTREYGTVYDPTHAAYHKIQTLTELDFPDTLLQFEGTGRFYPKN
jgi:poly-gamma-glutamate capsule biosynthesis protein CapA/YwtB (metallophosphatase superfamily)